MKYMNIKRMHAATALTTTCSVHNIILPYLKVHLCVCVCSSVGMTV